MRPYRKYRTYLAWARYHGVPPDSPYIQYRCDNCSKRNAGQLQCDPRNWFRIPDQYDPSVWAGEKSRRVRGLVCEKCGDKWRRENSDIKLVSLDQEIAVTSRVEQKLRRQAEVDVPMPTSLRCLLYLKYLPPLLFLLLVIPLSIISFQKYDNGEWSSLTAWFVVLIGSFGLPIITALIIKRLRLPLEKERENSLREQILIRARERAASIKEREIFYSSSEWLALRKEIVREQERRCMQCGKWISDDFQLTVDHVLPRSKYPELALDKSNLRVLCEKKGTVVLAQ